ncbi:GNAT family N-acetyltransferase [Chengkuizengella sediminis]|uniref:GNAT family N-acetyltransferase n=1 Tax=Chengkuizengella sediminis TaxID=1885917 RepID=UPI001389453D|nr:GNAT family N-acetyltransferase [Chengkuizengella sediminis]NDI33182.1 GNAT family N-acetyltransferase [Chengkuizengella sediminis]
MNIRLAGTKDIEQLIKMRWDFTLEDYPDKKIQDSDYNQFHEECESFLLNAFNNNHWYIWVVEIEGKIVSNIYIEVIHKVPRPGRITYPFGYMTNVYTIPESRGLGLGSKLMTEINKWAEELNYEFIIVWPSEQSIDFYSRNGYIHCKEPMENTLS